MMLLHVLRCLLGLLLCATVVSAACDQTLSVGADVAATLASATAGTTVCLNTGSYGTVTLVNVNKASDVVLQSTSGRTATVYFDVSGTTNHLAFQNLTIGSFYLHQGPTNLTIGNNTFIGQALMRFDDGYMNANIILEQNTFDGITVCPTCYEGRLSIISNTGQPTGLIVRYNHFGGGGDSDGIQYNSYYQVIGPGNVFEDLNQDFMVAHVDSIQGFGQKFSTITGNYFNRDTIYLGFYAGGENEVFTNNVFGPDRTCISCGSAPIQILSMNGFTFSHNTIHNFGMIIGSKSAYGNEVNGIITNNLWDGSQLVDGDEIPGCATCTIAYNLWTASGSARGTNTVIGTPLYVGGATPATWAGYQLTPSSPGYHAGNDGFDMGTLFYGAAVTPTPAPLVLRLVR